MICIACPSTILLLRPSYYTCVLCDDLLVCADNLPIIPRPLTDEFLSYAREGKWAQVAEVLYYYPDLVDITDDVSV